MRCDAPITLPKDGTYPAYSFRTEGTVARDVWGDFAPTGVIEPFTDWTFTGKGTQDIPAVACLGGLHNDENVIWMQVNDGGEIMER